MSETWKWVRKGCRIERGGREVAEVNVSYCDETTLNQRGHLIAAAPDMYAALETLLPEGWDDGVMDHMPGVKGARLALAKAKGITA